MAAWFGWPVGLYRTVRDGVYESLGHVPPRRVAPGRFINGKPLGLQLRYNGSAAYVVYHRQFFDPRAYHGIEDGGVAWLRIDEIARFNREVLPRLAAPIVVVTPESDWTVPGDFPRECDELVRSGKVRRWFANNHDCSTHRDLMVPLPIGVNYDYKYRIRGHGTPRDGYYCLQAPPPAQQDTWFDRAREAQPRLAARRLLAFGDFALNNSSRNRRYGESRADIQAVLARSDCVVFPPLQLPHARLTEAYAQHAFVLSPHGGGYDCYRTWEALACGCIAIVKQSPIDPLFAGLPVVIVERWEEVTRANLERWLVQFGDDFDRTRMWQVLSLDYWLHEINQAAAL